MKNNEHWAKQKESKGGYLGIKLMMFLYKCGGAYVFKICLYPVIFFYYLFSKEQRENSKYFLKLVNEKREKEGLKRLTLSSYLHFIAFGEMMFDKLKSWKGDIKLNKDAFYTEGSEKALFDLKEGKGKVFLCSHLGNIDALRAIGESHQYEFPIVNSIVFIQNAANFNHLLQSIAPNAKLNLIATNEIGPDTAILLKEKVDKGEIVAIVGDRLPAAKSRDDQQRVSSSSFLDKEANFPQGPFILCSILKCPIQLLFGLKNHETGKIDIVCKDFSDSISLSRKNREQDLQNYIDKYAKELEYYAMRYPYQWFNFFDFFKK